MEEENDTTIRLSKTTRDKLATIGNKDDSFEIIISRLYDFYVRYKGVVERAR